MQLKSQALKNILSEIRKENPRSINAVTIVIYNHISSIILQPWSCPKEFLDN